jgi:hypothetical protein
VRWQPGAAKGPPGVLSFKSRGASGWSLPYPHTPQLFAPGWGCLPIFFGVYVLTRIIFPALLPSYGGLPLNTSSCSFLVLRKTRRTVEWVVTLVHPSMGDPDCIQKPHQLFFVQDHILDMNPKPSRFDY